jgi:hypothetical protein
MTYPVGVIVVVAFEVRPPVVIPARVVPDIIVPVIFEFVMIALVRLLPDKSELTRLTPDRSIPVKFAFRTTRDGPRKYPYEARATYDADGSVALPTPMRPPPHIIFVNVAPVKFALVMVVVVNVAPVRLAFVKLVPATERPVNSCEERAAPVRFTAGPTIYPVRMT